MTDRDCVALLQWALPGLRMRWRGFRRVRRQVCKRIHRRLQELGLEDGAAYRRYLERHPGEWDVLDHMCRVTISRFCRDRRVYEGLVQTVLPALSERAAARGTDAIRIWSAGCGSGEEAYSLSIAWRLGVRGTAGLSVIGTDVDAHLLVRARNACYEHGSLEEIPPEWRTAAFFQSDGRHCLRDQFKEGVHFAVQDVRRTMPPGPFDAVLCRNFAFTYFDESLQREILEALVARLSPHGALVVGKRESVPDGAPILEPWPGVPAVYHRI